MRYRFTGAVVAVAVAAAALTVMRTDVQTQGPQPARIDGRPNLNGIWQSLSGAHWNLEDHSASAFPLEFFRLGAIGAVPAGQSVIAERTIPYRPAALKQREQNRANWPQEDPEAKCYMPGVPRGNYMPYPFQIVQGQRDILFVYEFASANRPVFMSNHQEAPVDTWMGWSNGSWEGDTLVVNVNAFNGMAWLDRAGNHFSDQLRVTERFTLAPGGSHLQYEARLEDPVTYERPWTIRMPLYRRVEQNVQLLEFKCVEFSEELLYGHLKKVD